MRDERSERHRHCETPTCPPKPCLSRAKPRGRRRKGAKQSQYSIPNTQYSILNTRAGDAVVKRKFLVSVIGGHRCSAKVSNLAEEVGRVIADSGAALVCGGLGGTMEAACRGAKEAGGTTIGIIPGEDKNKANKFVDIVIPTGMGFSRNTLVAGTGDVVVALPGEYGTLSEISFALIGKKPVYGFDTWDIRGIVKLKDVEELKNVLGREIKRSNDV